MVKIYGLTDPRNGKLRYVGKTEQSLHARLMRHISNAKKHQNLKAKWICQLLGEGVRPEIHLIEEVDKEEWQEAEAFWVDYFWQEYGSQLLNTADGGVLGNPGTGHTEKTKQKIRKAMEDRDYPQEWRERLSKSRQGIEPWNKGKSRRSETKKKISKKSKEWWEDPEKEEERQKMLEKKSESMKGNTNASGPAHNRNLTYEIAEEIRDRYEAGGVTQMELAGEYGVSQSTIGNIVRGETYTEPAT